LPATSRNTGRSNSKFDLYSERSRGGSEDLGDLVLPDLKAKTCGQSVPHTVKATEHKLEM